MTYKPTVRIKPFSRFREYAEQRQRQRDAEEWSIEYLIDEIFFSLMSVKKQFCTINSSRRTSLVSDPKKVEFIIRCNSGNGILRRTYEEQARYKMYRMPIYRPPPVFVISLKDLDDKVKAELAKRDKKLNDHILKRVAARICSQVDERYFLLSAKPFLKVRLEN